MKACWICNKEKTKRDLTMCKCCALPSMKKGGEVCCEECARKIERKIKEKNANRISN